MYIYVPAKKSMLSGPGCQPSEPFLTSFLVATLSSESLEPLIDFLAYLGPKLWLK